MRNFRNVSSLFVFETMLNAYLNRPPLPPFLCRSWLLRPIWLFRGGEKWVGGGRVGEVLKSSSMSRTLARRLLEGGSISFILFCICMVFRLNFSPGLDILKSQGIHWRNITRTWYLNWFLWISQKNCNFKRIQHLIWIWIEKGFSGDPVLDKLLNWLIHKDLDLKMQKKNFLI